MFTIDTTQIRTVIPRVIRETKSPHILNELYFKKIQIFLENSMAII